VKKQTSVAENSNAIGQGGKKLSCRKMPPPLCQRKKRSIAGRPGATQRCIPLGHVPLLFECGFAVDERGERFGLALVVLRRVVYSRLQSG
jgi:hypothetical protein